MFLDEILQEQQPNSFQLYSKDSSLDIANSGYGVLFLVDRGVNGLNTLANLNIAREVNGIYLPKEITIYGKTFQIKQDIIDSALNLKKEIFSAPQDIKSSFILDITPYISFIFMYCTYIIVTILI